MNPRIEWRNGHYSTSDGYIDKYPLFHISWTSGKTPYGLSTSLPLRMRVTSFASEAEAKTYAERVIRSFLKGIGAGFRKMED